MENPVRKMKNIINKIKEADDAYFNNDNPIMSDYEYDKLISELKAIEQETGIIFSDSPTKKVGGDINKGFKEVYHTRPMLSSKKTKSRDEIIAFINYKDVVVSWKLDGLTLVLRYENGLFQQAITRGRDGLIGEDVTHTVKYMRNIPMKVPCLDKFEVRGEGVCSWSDFELIKKQEGISHPRNVAAGTIRSLIADQGKLSHLDFIAFELIEEKQRFLTKKEQLDFLLNNNFDVVEHTLCNDDIRKIIDQFNPQDFSYPVDGLMFEYNDLIYGKSLGATHHHENCRIALKWDDELHETIFKGVELITSRTGVIEINALFEPIEINGSLVCKANIHGFEGFKKLKLGIGDIIKVYKANMIVPQIAENITQSGTYQLSEYCPCCGKKLTIKVSSSGSKNLFCDNEDCLSRNAYKLARFCERKAMNIDILSVATFQKLMEQGLISSYRDIYHLSEHKDRLLSGKKVGISNYDVLFEKIENSRKTTLSRFLYSLGIPLVGPECSKLIGEHFYESMIKFLDSLSNDYDFSNIKGINPTINTKIHEWFNNEKNISQWKPLLDELHFEGDKLYQKSSSSIKTIALVGADEDTFNSLMPLFESMGIKLEKQTTLDTDYILVSLKK